MDINEIFLNACKNGQKGVIQAFLKKGGIDFDKRDKYGNTCLMYVCLKGYKDITKLILENGADSNLANNESITPLHAVSENGNKEIAEMLLGASADINATNKNVETPLMYSITEKRTTMVKFLVERGADISIKDNQEHKAIDYATANGLRDIISILTSDIIETNITGDTPLHQACYNEQSEVVKELLKNENVLINSINDDGNTPLVIV